MVWDVVRNLLAEEFSVDPDEITGETDFYEDLSADSLDMVEIIMSLEEHFDISIEMEDKINTVKELADLVDEKVSK